MGYIFIFCDPSLGGLCITNPEEWSRTWIPSPECLVSPLVARVTGPGLGARTQHYREGKM